MTISELLSELKQRDVKLRSDGGTLKVDGPKGALTPDLVASIRENKARLLELFPAQNDSQRTIPARQDRREFPLSFSQHAFFMLAQLDPGNRGFNIHSVRHLTGPIDPAILERAVQDVVDRHESLRTRFELRDGAGVQIVESNSSVRVQSTDISDLPEALKEQQIAALSARDRGEPFDIRCAPLFRIEFVRISPLSHLFVLSMHHIISDAVSLDVFYRDLLEAYLERLAGRVPQFAPLPLQYGDYAAWQRQRMEGGALSGELEFWRDELAGVPRLLDALSHAKGGAGDHASSIKVALPDALARRMRRFADAQGATPFAVLLAAFQCLLARYARTVDVPVIVPFTARTEVETERMIGLFVNGLVVRTRLTPGITAVDLVQATRKKIAQVLSHRELSVESLEGLFRMSGRPEPALARMSRIGFNYIASPGRAPMQMGGLTVEPREVDRANSVFELMLTVTDSPSEVTVRIEYKDDLFHEGLIEQLGGDFVDLIGAMIDAPGQNLDALEFSNSAVMLPRLGLDPGLYERVSPLPPRTRELELVGGAKDGNRRVLGYAVDLPWGEGASVVFDCIDALVSACPILRIRIVPSPLTWLDREYACVRRVGEAVEIPEIEAGDDLSESMAVESIGIRNIYAERAWRSVILGRADGRRQFVFLANEALLGARAVDAHRNTVLRAFEGSFEAAEFEDAVERENRGSVAESNADVGDLAPLTCVLEARGATQAAVVQRHIVRAELADISEWCRANQTSLSEFLQSIYGLLIQLYTQAEGPFYFWHRTIDETSEVLTARTPENPAALEIARLPPNEINFVFEESAFPQLWSGYADGCVYLSWQAQRFSATLSLAFDPAVFNENRFLDRMISIARQLTGGLASWSNLNLLTGNEAEQIASLNDTARSYPAYESIVYLFRAQVSRTPDWIGVSCGSRTLSYREIDRLSDQLAASLTFHEGVIGVCLTRSEMLPVAMLAVMKAGAAYLPLDPDFPSERLRYAIEKTEAAIVLAEHSTRAALPDSCNLLLLEDLLRRPAHAPQRSNDLAYVMFTSGSTGRPKGVCVGHRAVANFLRSMAECPGIAAGDVLVAVTTPAFDISVLELFLPLTVGARVVVADRETVRSGDRLAALLDECGATVLQATPSGWMMLLDAGWQGRRSLKALCGGEPVPAELAARLRPKVKELWNLYGPTETTVWSTVADVTEETSERVPIGRPIANTQLYVTDSQRRHVPPGFPGELYIAGSGIGAGYYGEPGLTAERFVELVTPDGQTVRAYKTGDLVRMRADEQLEFLRRIDRQVKLRGHRIELEEIEACLMGCEGISRAVAVIREDAGGPSLAAYYTSQGEPIRPERLRAFLFGKLPDYMVPQWLVQLRSLPLTPNGKIDHKALPKPQPEAPAAIVAPTTELERTLASIWADALGHESFGARDNFFDIGGHSLLLLRTHRRIATEIDERVRAIDLFNYPTIAELAAHLQTLQAPIQTVPVSPRNIRRKEPSADYDVAVIGMAGRFPGAASLWEFWENLAAGVESIAELGMEELKAEGVPDELLGNQSYVRAASVLAGIELFDADFFNMAPRVAAFTDPQHRLLLECAYAAIEDAGYNPYAVSGEGGVFTGVGFNSYLVNNILPNRVLLNGASPLELLYANDRDYASTLISYKLNLTGPSMTLATACSTSLVAIHSACRSLIGGECDFALAGGAKISVPQKVGYIHYEGGIFSRDGHCRAFDDGASGTVFGSGVGIVVLKRLADARRDRDAVYAVIKGSAINNDGASKVGYTAPSLRGQARAVSDAYALSGVDPDTIQYVEMHGTGTRLGDPVEVAALTEAFRGYTDRRGFCAISSVKSNIGHLDPAAGIAGFIKAVLAIDCGKIPPAAQFRKPNSHIAFADTPFYVNEAPADWEAEKPRRAGVSSFGIGGTNAHVVLEEPPAPEVTAVGEKPELMVLSARTLESFDAARAQLAMHLEQHHPLGLRDVAYTLQTGRPAFRYRFAAAAMDRGDAIARLRSAVPAISPDRSPAIAFLFPGQGSQYAGMAGEIYAAEPIFRKHFDACTSIVQARAGWDLQKVASGGLTDTLYVQPALFAAEYALAQLLIAWGIRPAALLGHSLGEYVAACVAESLSLEEALGLVLERARWMQETPPGRMAAIMSSQSVVAGLLDSACAIAAVNSSEVTVISGPEGSVDRTIQRCRARGIHAQLLSSTRGFHSPLMEPALAPLTAYAHAHARAREPRIPYISNFTAKWVDQSLLSADYWARHARHPVLFDQGLKLLLSANPSMTLLEVGHGQALGNLVRRVVRDPEQAVVSCLPKQPEVHALLDSVGALFLRGHAIDWSAFHPDPLPNRVHLPTYPFQRNRHWIDRNPKAIEPGVPATRRESPDEWLYETSWKRKRLNGGTAASDRGSVLIFGGEDSFSEALRRAIKARGRRALMVYEGSAETLLAAIANEGVTDVIHLWNLQRTADIREALARGFYTLLPIARAEVPIRVAVVTSGGQNVTGAENLRPECALSMGPILTLPREHPGLKFAQIDIEGECADWILAELNAGLPEPIVAYRGQARWVQCFEPFHSEPASQKNNDGGAYWITGGLGGLGFEIAQTIARSRRANLILSGRGALNPERREKLHRLEAEGVRVHCMQADVTDLAAMERGFHEVAERIGRIDCVIHAAGVADSGLAQFRKRDQMEAVLAPKVQGSLILSRLCARYGVDSLVFFSSITGITGDIGQIAYTSANAFMDALAESERREGRRVYSINWDTWAEVGMARDTPVPAALRAFRDARLALGIRNQEGTALLEQILSGPPAQVIVSTIPIEERSRPAAHEAPVGAAIWQQERPASLRHPAEPAATDTERRLLELWRDSFGLANVGTMDDFFELGGSSLQAIGLVAKIEKVFQRKLDPGALLQHPTVRAVAGLLDKADAKGVPALISMQRPGAEPPWVLIHPVGGQLYHYRALLESMDSQRKVYGIRSPRTDALAQIENVEALASEYVRALREVQPDGPFYLAGSSFGGTIAFEMAQQLNSAGLPIALLALLDTPGGEQVKHEFREDAEILAYFASELPPEFGLTIEELRAVPAGELRDYFRRRTQQFAPEMPGFDLETMNETLAVFKRNMSMMKAYRPRWYPGELHFFKAIERRPQFDPMEPESAWRPVCRKLTLIEIPGNHFTMHAPPHAAILAAELDRISQVAPLERAVATPHG